MSAPESSLYDRVGGQAYFVALVDRFHEHVERDPVLRPLYPGGPTMPRRSSSTSPGRRRCR
jgi:hemoglobin